MRISKEIIEKKSRNYYQELPKTILIEQPKQFSKKNATKFKKNVEGILITFFIKFLQDLRLTERISEKVFKETSKQIAEWIFKESSKEFPNKWPFDNFLKKMPKKFPSLQGNCQDFQGFF